MSSKVWKSLIIFLHVALFIPWFARSEEKDERVANSYLSKYGYMLPKFSLTKEESDESLKEALRNFQWFAGINITGVLDNVTLGLMKLPRCGVTDEINVSAYLRRRKKRYILQGSMWPIRELTYKISKFTNDIQHKEIEEAIDKAFQMWSDSANITFRKVSEGKSNFNIKFEIQAHGDNYRFDGPGGTLGHAFYPKDGRIHFDDEEDWIIGAVKKKGTDLVHTAVHEIGHGLGLGHSNDPESIMYGIYKGFKREVQLNRDDIEAIQALYGPNKDPPKSPDTTKPTSNELPTNAPSLCKESGPSFDAITYAGDRNLYAFKDNFVWILNDASFDTVPAQKISSLWRGLSGKLDAALTWSDKSTFFFKGDSVWKYNNKRELIAKYPKLIKDEFGLKETNIDAAFVWTGNGKVYFVKGNNYWRYDYTAVPSINLRYPQTLTKNWKGLPNKIDDAFAWKDRRTYFFLGNNYYRLKNRGVEVEHGFPKKITIRWLGCDQGNFKTPNDYERCNTTSDDIEEDEKENNEISRCIFLQASTKNAVSSLKFGQNFKIIFIILTILLSKLV